MRTWWSIQHKSKERFRFINTALQKSDEIYNLHNTQSWCFVTDTACAVRRDFSTGTCSRSGYVIECAGTFRYPSAIIVTLPSSSFTSEPCCQHRSPLRVIPPFGGHEIVSMSYEPNECHRRWDRKQRPPPQACRCHLILMSTRVWQEFDETRLRWSELPLKQRQRLLFKH